MSQVFYLSCRDSRRIYKSNSPSSFRVVLPSDREFIGPWECGLVSINLFLKDVNSKNIFISCDLVTTSYVRGRDEPILRSIPVQADGWVSFEFSNVWYIPMTTEKTDQINVRLLDDNLSPVDFVDHHLSCMIHCRQR